jgi:hypothetical protein
VALDLLGAHGIQAREQLVAGDDQAVQVALGQLPRDVGVAPAQVVRVAVQVQLQRIRAQQAGLARDAPQEPRQAEEETDGHRDPNEPDRRRIGQFGVQCLGDLGQLGDGRAEGGQGEEPPLAGLDDLPG